MKAVLITGATGKQGGSVVGSLVARKAPFKILAVTRNPQSASAQRLAKLSSNIKLVEGDLDKPNGIFPNAQNVTKIPIWGVFSVLVRLLFAWTGTRQQLTIQKKGGRNCQRSPRRNARQSPN